MTCMVCAALTAGAQIQRPRLVVGIVVDQMRWDYLYYYYNQFGNGGLKRLVDEGYSCENQHLNYVPTITAIGHTSIYTGSTPALNGIAGNDFYLNGKKVYCCTDSTVQGVGTTSAAGQMSPHNLYATTIGDELKLATDFKSKVISISLKDRASILPAGHSADAAYWFDNSVGHFVTSTYYMKQLPDWVQQFNTTNNYTPGKDIKPTNEGVTMTFKMAEAALLNEQLGRHDVPDMLCVSVSSTDAIGHAYGTRGQENHDVYMQLDKDFAHFLSVLDKQVGRGNYLLFFTADHGGAHSPNFLKAHKIPTGGWDGENARKELNLYLDTKFGVTGDIVDDLIDNIYHIDRNLLKKTSLDYAEVKKAAVERLSDNHELAYVVDYENIATQTIPQAIRERIINGYNRERTGDIIVITRPQVLFYSFPDNYRGTSHGAWNPYDTHIPLVFMGWHISHGATSVPTRMVDTAPTVCAMLHIQMPDACIGDAIVPVVSQK